LQEIGRREIAALIREAIEAEKAHSSDPSTGGAPDHGKGPNRR
jgi:hypothetical protein